MKQILQSFKTGETILEEIPVPNVGRGSVLIQTSHSLVSLGTERMLVEFGKAGIIEKAYDIPSNKYSLKNPTLIIGVLNVYYPDISARLIDNTVELLDF